MTDRVDQTEQGAVDGATPPAVPGRARVLVLLAAVVWLVVWASRAGQLRTLVVAVAFAAMIFLHEAGHFLTARLTGMKTTEFFLGFGPRIWSFRRGEMEYGIKAVPLGGYVKILGMHNLDRGVDPADEARTYRQQSFSRRVLVASAGTLMHLVLALVLFVVLFAGTGRIVVSEDPVVRQVLAVDATGASPARAAGIRSGDRIVSIDGRRTNTWDDVLQGVGSRPDRTVPIEVQRNGRIVRLQITPIGSNGVGRIGVCCVGERIQRDSIPSAVVTSVQQIWRLMPGTFEALGAFFAPSHLRTYTDTLVNAGGPAHGTLTPADQNRFMSPVGAVSLVKDASRTDIRWALEIFAAMNVFVGVFNMLPMLPLDGGHVLIAIYERLRSTRTRKHHADISRLIPLTYAVMAVMMAIGLSSLYLDIRNPIDVF